MKETNSLPFRIHAILGLTLILFVTGCASNTESGGFGFENDALLISEERERELGTQEHPKILAAFGGAYQNPVLQTGLNNIVARLSRASPRPDVTYSLTILNTPSVNAFALPGGYLYVTRGLLALANDEDEIAAVLAHEMGHVSSRHAVKREKQTTAIAVLGQVMKNIMNNPGRATSSMLDNRESVAKFSRQQEYEADQIGLETSVQAGFDPFGASSFLTSMQRNNEFRNRLLASGNTQNHGVDFLASHPSTPDRITRVTKLAGSFGFDVGDRPRSQSGYLDIIDGMVFGNDPSEGFVRDRRFIHPELRFEFEVAKGFTIQNTSDAVFALGPKGSALRFDGVDVPVTQSLDIYINRVWAKGITVRDLHEIPIGNSSAVIGRANHGGWDYRLAVVRFEGKRTFRFLMAARKITPKMNAAFEASVQSLRQLGIEEAKQVKPLRITIETVRPGQTAQYFAARMSAREGALDQFMILNSLRSGQTLRPGQRVKIISE